MILLTLVYFIINLLCFSDSLSFLKTFNNTFARTSQFQKYEYNIMKLQKPRKYSFVGSQTITGNDTADRKAKLISKAKYVYV